MPYTTQGFMTWDDIRDWEESTDNGVIHIDMTDPPEWFEAPIACPLEDCDQTIAEHDGFTVTRAGGNIVSCTTA